MNPILVAMMIDLHELRVRPVHVEDRSALCNQVFKGRPSGNPEFHPAPGEKGLGVPPPCLEVLPDFQKLCGCGLSDRETPGSFP
jgi:hypothetical protein